MAAMRAAVVDLVVSSLLVEVGSILRFGPVCWSTVG